MNQLVKSGTTEIATTDAASIMAVISKAAADPNTDVVKLEKMLDMYERIMSKNSEAEFNRAMSEAQSEMRPIVADEMNPQTRSKYASYAALDNVLRPIYTRHGFSPSFNTGDSSKPEHIRIYAYLAHRGGHSRTYQIDMPADGKGAKGGDVMTKTHATGSAVTYGQRYLLKAMFNIAIVEDDDGNGATAIPRITEQQAADLQCLIDEVKADKQKFLAYLAKAGKVSINRLEDVPAVMHKDAVEQLERKRGAK